MQVNSVTSPAASQSNSTSTLPFKTLTQEDFLTLLVKQMTSQDPMNPKQDTDFIAQMAQFTSLQQSQTMGNDIAGLRSSQNVLQASSLIGKTVDLQVDKETMAHGVVSAVQIEAGTPKLVVNDQKYDLSQLVTLSVTPTPETN